MASALAVSGNTLYLANGTTVRTYNATTGAVIKANFIPGPHQLVVRLAVAGTATRAYPVNFKVFKSIKRNDGVLVTYCTWESSSGNLADIVDCEVGELVRYPAISAGLGCMTGTLADVADCKKGPEKPADCYPWPDPWTIETANPFIIWLPGKPPRSCSRA